MKDEIAAAVVFLMGIVKRNNTLNQEQLSKIADNLAIALIEKYRNHWYEDKPSKGQGFRCIRVSGDEPRDTVLLKVARKCGLRYSDLKLPMDLTLWVDPSEVACRFGEKGTTCTLASFPRKSTSSPQSVLERESSSTGSSPVSSDSESDTETPTPSYHHPVTFQPLNFIPDESRLYQMYRRNGRHQQYRSNQVVFAARDKYRWVNNPVIVHA
ncbi:protein BTG2-like [Amphiura filiformis]|uniref:protein BTG2-like n=1 Tax=Amphiura filiformis TaxID=82378 RepID=UPI003B22219E